MVQLCREQWTITAKEMKAKLNLKCSESTIRRRLHEAGLRNYFSTNKPFLTKSSMQERLAWARKYVKWSQRKWKQVLFSDESALCLHFAKRTRV